MSSSPEIPLAVQSSPGQLGSVQSVHRRKSRLTPAIWPPEHGHDDSLTHRARKATVATSRPDAVGRGASVQCPGPTFPYESRRRTQIRSSDLDKTVAIDDYSYRNYRN